jgi:hypothetical protein
MAGTTTGAGTTGTGSAATGTTGTAAGGTGVRALSVTGAAVTGTAAAGAATGAGAAASGSAAPTAEAALPSMSGTAVGEDANCSKMLPQGTPGLGSAPASGLEMQLSKIRAALLTDTAAGRWIFGGTLPRP